MEQTKRVLQVGDVCIIRNRGKHRQGWLENELGQLVRITSGSFQSESVEYHDYVYVEKLDGTEFSKDRPRRHPAPVDIWTDNLELADDCCLKCAECQKPIRHEVVDYLCQGCRNE